MILASGATDSNSGLLLALLALAYWPVKSDDGSSRSHRPGNHTTR